MSNHTCIKNDKNELDQALKDGVAPKVLNPINSVLKKA
jgi:hypothetical protein